MKKFLGEGWEGKTVEKELKKKSEKFLFFEWRKKKKFFSYFFQKRKETKLMKNFLI